MKVLINHVWMDVACLLACLWRFVQEKYQISFRKAPIISLVEAKQVGLNFGKLACGRFTSSTSICHTLKPSE